jgi:hypothetical protein
MKIRGDEPLFGLKSQVPIISGYELLHDGNVLQMVLCQFCVFWFRSEIQDGFHKVSTNRK